VEPEAATEIPATSPPNEPSAIAGSATATTGLSAEAAEIRASWPRRLESGASSTVNVTLLLVPELDATAPVPDDRVEVSSTVEPFGTPGSRLDQALGPSFDVSVQATLTAPGLGVETVGEADHLIDDLSVPVEWVWNVTGEENGRHVADVAVEMRWEDPDKGIVVERVIWRGQLQIDIEQNVFSLRDVGWNQVLTSILLPGIPALATLGIARYLKYRRALR
jgi:hypothetical protein